MTREELIRKVALKMDEISSSDEVVVQVNSGDNNPLYAQINSLLNESVNEVLMKAPINRLHMHVIRKGFATLIGNNAVTKDYTEEETVRDGRIKVICKLPDNFLRFVYMEDHNLQRPITELANTGDDTDKRQHNRHIMAKEAKPVGVLNISGSDRSITIYSYVSSAIASPVLYYVARYDKTNLTEDSGLDEFLVDVISWVCAGKVFSAQGDVNRGKLCDENAAALMI